jgi:cytoskeletal protein RodZ
MQRLGLVLVWVVATVAVTVLAWRVVLAADAQVSERPITQVVAVPSTATRPTLSVPEQTSTSLDLDPEAPQRSSTTTTVEGASTSTTIEGSNSSTSTTTSTSTTATTAAVAFAVRTIPTEGGSVTVRYRPGEVGLVAVVPVSGWTWELEKEEVADIEGTFRRDDDKVTVRARWVDGEFVSEVKS